MHKTRRGTLAQRSVAASQSRMELDVREFYYPQHPAPVHLNPATTDYVWGQPLGYAGCAAPAAASCGFQQRYTQRATHSHTATVSLLTGACAGGGRGIFSGLALSAIRIRGHALRSVEAHIGSNLCCK